VARSNSRQCVQRARKRQRGNIISSIHLYDSTRSHTGGFFISTWRSIEVDRFRRCPNARHFQFRDEYRRRRWLHVSIIHQPGIAGYNMRESSSLTIPVKHNTGDAVNTSACLGVGESSGELFVAGHTHVYGKIFPLITPHQRGEQQHQQHHSPTSTYSSTYCRTSCSILYVWQVHTRYIIGYPSNHTCIFPILPAESELFGGGELGSVSPLSSPLRSPARGWFKQSW